MSKELHIISISGGKDSAAMAIYLKDKYPDRKFEYLFFDTGEELQDTYDYLSKLQAVTGIKIEKLLPKKSFKELLFEHNNFLPSPQQRWCTKRMKLETFLEKIKQYEGCKIFNYVGIRADEDRLGLVPNQDNIITVMPFKDDGITLEDVKRILNDSGLGLPKYYTPVKDEKYDIEYYRTRSGCYFCFFMRQIEWVWLYEKHPDEFQKAMEFEKEGYTWIQGMPLSELCKAENIDRIKKTFKAYEERKKQAKNKKDLLLGREFLSKHDKDLEDFEDDKFCSFCTL
ncbi:phosphoadenosine phosphosulfate reductase family protein [Campylobacter sp. RM12642]|uniref:phosphoadenosine phosphosulfate reductase family protein n=1 Tax=unclassified Campylobacter TaxID=2593542 RepID=UPI001BDB415F|nr:phosphoadenosine phosphosulfate reductase family protein [Campylobacter sp. 2018MI01]MBT0878855.1 phosphoadenosine phosphosulfate reductase family protein [Campylobacter sp. 2018MI01]MBZ7977785.1 phosphoadenosine phosphosulfate reductase family protein [Campylobacter sp. RM12654]MBZ7980595.1 phosphoadenosine phosphosulfate reductase family protein [Campylobacter sp. RM12642]MBZ8008090.1 phosphoadenosine phosphosulfate reductase family protein [Campylobacter sp. RM9334]